jgi:AraC family transcriptional regulator, regulatory protein of adaptative response / methylated-DNA-[protein]-cysteine methyltransferase
MEGVGVISSDEGRWQAVVQRDSQAVRAFVYGVLTTGIYCRPGCASRLPKRENVRFFDTWEDAERAGLRPCKRCTPQKAAPRSAATEAVAKACELIQVAEHPLSLQELADAVGLSPHYFHRVFKRTVGITPKQYADEKRMERVRASIRSEDSITGAIYGAGFESSSSFYATSTALLGMTPTEYRHGGDGVMITFAMMESYLGWVLVAATDQGICRIDFDDSPDALRSRLATSFPKARLLGDVPEFAATVSRVLSFLDCPEQGLELPLDVRGTAFQRRVWAALQELPVGSTASYSDVASRIGQPKAARAVAGACASNQIAVAIPCHRVVRSDGALGGYRWGLERKRALLDRESTQA